jgi:hypothetical protein
MGVLSEAGAFDEQLSWGVQAQISEAWISEARWAVRMSAGDV